MIFGFIPYEFFPGKKLDEETLTNLIVFYQVPHQEGYLSIIFSKMDDKDWLILNHMKKELDLSGQGSVVVQGIKNSICSFHARKCYQAEATRNVVIIYLPDQGLQFSLPKEMSSSIENLIAIKER